MKLAHAVALPVALFLVLPRPATPQVRGSDALFADGFDDGHACPWSALVPSEPPLISEIVVQPTEAEFVEIYNPAPPAVDLSDFYLADYPAYHGVTTATLPPDSSDFRARFPNGASLPCGEHIVVALESAAAYHLVYGSYPDYDFAAADPNAPDMTGELLLSSGLTNASEMVVLFRWDGASDLVADSDYVFYGTTTTNAMDKSGIEVGTSTYLPETPAASQAAGSPPGVGASLQRCDFGETSEAKSGGNGIAGHDETSESFASAFRIGTPTPGAAPSASLCL